MDINTRIYNFSAGPAMIPEPVLERAREELLSLGGIGMSVMEISHRSSHFERVLNHAEQGIRDLLDVPGNYRILFLQGGATLQFEMVPMNFLRPGQFAEYVITGAWGTKAQSEAKRCGDARVAFTTKDSGFTSAPTQDALRFSPDAAFVHYTSNETIEGVEFKYDLDAGGVPVVCDACSNILSKPIGVEKYAIVYAGAQKNIGPSGVTVVIIRDDMIERVPEGQFPMLDYRVLAKNNSMLNTPNTWGIYMVGLVCDWLKEQGGLAAMKQTNEEKAAILYNAIDSSDGYYRGHAERASRSVMNVTFRLPNEDLEKRFCDEATLLGMDGLAGHRSVGGIRASIYNAFPKAGVEHLVEFMSEFAQKNG
ncbi:MAG: 3-phosphoserine/phosphohydroxythreonine transaminase [Pyrinomonadaceae bacterium]|nr:3-phosphoserine/phosphohydroxythreonine transaminase [Blastocatellia bacterium]MCW5958203.1 3-phosphoserine/phosphohydroxythreonine transaminase [Pyrinomonadaceae bacterium]